MKKIILAATFSAIFTPHFAQAQVSTQTQVQTRVVTQSDSKVIESKVTDSSLIESKPENEVSFNLALTSDYRYRGITQTRFKPALQGGVDYVNNPSGFYAGAWLSTIKWTKDAGGGGNMEADLYAGKRGSITSEVSYDVGVLSYVYPYNALVVDANTTEVYGQLNYGVVFIKYSHSATNLFGFNKSKNSGYVDFGANIELDKGLILNLHTGRQMIKNNDNYSYNDWRIGLTKDFGIVSASVSVIGTNANKLAYASPINGKFTGDTKVVGMISKVF